MKRRNKFEKKKVKKEEAKYLTELQKNARQQIERTCRIFSLMNPRTIDLRELEGDNRSRNREDYLTDAVERSHSGIRRKLT